MMGERKWNLMIMGERKKNGRGGEQGRTVINSKFCSGLLGNLIRTEFELRHGIEHEVRNTVYNYAIFGGSNGYWRTRVLQDVGMDPEMLTEDVDSAIRALSHGYKVWYDHHLVALEQPPPSFHALLKQRLRWSQGWFQVARRSILPMYTSERFALWTKVGMWWIARVTSRILDRVPVCPCLATLASPNLLSNGILTPFMTRTSIPYLSCQVFLPGIFSISFPRAARPE